MNWQVNIDQVAQEDGKLVLYTILFSDKAKIGKTYRFEGGSDLDKRWKRTLQADLDALNNADLSFVKISTGIPDLTIVDDRTDEQKARDAYFSNIALYNHMTRAIATGVKTVQDKDYTDLVSKLKTDFLDSYIDLF